jgi:hypothetical protein
MPFAPESAEGGVEAAEWWEDKCSFRAARGAIRKLRSISKLLSKITAEESHGLGCLGS